MKHQLLTDEEIVHYERNTRLQFAGFLLSATIVAVSFFYAGRASMIDQPQPKPEIIVVPVAYIQPGDAPVHQKKPNPEAKMMLAF